MAYRRAFVPVEYANVSVSRYRGLEKRAICMTYEV